MGRLRKRYNEKARASSGNYRNDSQESEGNVLIDMETGKEKYDESNPLVITGSRKKTTKVANNAAVVVKKPLSKKKRKKLENVLKRKKKLLQRSEILEKLSKVQAQPHELEFLTSTSEMQTFGKRKYSKLAEEVVIPETKIPAKLSNNKGKNKKHLLPPKKKLKLPPNVVSFRESSESDTDLSQESDTELDDGVSNTKATDIEKNENEETIQAHEVDGENSEEIMQENVVQEMQSQNDFENNVISTELPTDESKRLNEQENSSSQKSSSESLNPDSSNLKNSDSSEEKKVEELDVGNFKLPERVPAVYVSLDRVPEIQAARTALPIFCEEQAVVEAVRENSVIVIHGETGSGKTTQVPQFLYEAGFTQNNKLIGITEPRRIAAVTMSNRVGVEMNRPDLVSYHIRYEKTVDEHTEIKFMTDGVLLKEIRHDFFLSGYSVIIIDEAHERSVFSDVLIGLLSRIVPLREKRGDPLKLIIMSATMRVQDFTENPRLFKTPPFLIRIASRQYKVQVHFNLRTPDDYLEAAYRKVCKIHETLPPGAILVFLTGEKEVNALCKRLRKTFPFQNNVKSDSSSKTEETKPSTSNRKKIKRKSIVEESSNSFCALPPKIDLDDYAVEPLDAENLQHQFSDDEEERDIADNNALEEKFEFQPLYTLPLYSVLPSEEQEKVFEPPPAGSRLCVVSTNVAETSITIPGLKYVVDSGKEKTKVYDKFAGGISKFCITWCSKASANQRAGRAGRTEGGHCYRLYSSAVFEHDLPDFSPPEIQRIPVDDVLLQMKTLGIDRVVNFPFPSPPDSDALKSAERRLVMLGALQDLQKGERYKDIEKWEYSAKVTPLGKAMSRFPLSPRYAKMLLLSYKHDCIPYIITIVSAMTVPEVFLCSSPSDDNTDENPDGERRVLWKGIKKIGAGTGKSLQLGDAMVLLRAVALYEESENKTQFCMKNGIRLKAIVEVQKMSLQLIREMNRAFQDLSLPLTLKLEPPGDNKIETVRKIVTTGFTDHIARRITDEEWKKDPKLKNGYQCLDLEDPVFIHPSSILFAELPEYVIYQEIIHTSKYYMKGITEIECEWLPGFAPSLCHFSEPLEDPLPVYDVDKDQIICSMKATFGRWAWELPVVNKEMPKSLLKYSWFCFFLLDGQVCPLFKNYRKYLLSSPSVMLKTWAKLLPRTRYLLQAVISKEVDSKESLEKVWKKDPRYLLREYWEWLPDDKHMEVECKWPPKDKHV